MCSVDTTLVTLKGRSVQWLGHGLWTSLPISNSSLANNRIVTHEQVPQSLMSPFPYL